MNTTTRSFVHVLPVKADRVQEGEQRLQPGIGLVLVAQAPLDQGVDVLLRRGDQGVRALAVPQRGELRMSSGTLFLIGLAAAEDLLVVPVLVVFLDARSAVGSMRLAGGLTCSRR